MFKQRILYTYIHVGYFCYLSEGGKTNKREKIIDTELKTYLNQIPKIILFMLKTVFCIEFIWVDMSNMN